MRIRELTLRNVKLLADKPFSFVRPDGSIRNWTVLLGDNGLCKTTVLQAIALASSGEKMARALVQDATDYVRQDRPERGAEILATFETQNGELAVQMRVNGGHHAFRSNDGGRYLDDVRDRRTPGYFVVGYGTGRRLVRRGSIPFPRDSLTDRVKGLFDPRHDVLGLNFFSVLRDLGLGRVYAHTLRDMLLQPCANGDPLLPWLVGRELRSTNGAEAMEKYLESQRFIIEVDSLGPIALPSHLLSHGQQGILACVSDLLGQAILDAGRGVEPTSLTGLALLDEIDLHLHPRAQRSIMFFLANAFPRLQFVATINSSAVPVELCEASTLHLTASEMGIIGSLTDPI